MTFSLRSLPLTILGLASLSGLAIGGCQGPVPERSPATADPALAAAPAHPVAHAAQVLPAARTIEYVTEDGVHISATLQPAAAPDAPAVILVHQLGSDRAEWAPLLERLRIEPGFTTLAIDMRGHGQSTRGPNGVIGWSSFDASEWAATHFDVEGAITFLRGSGSGVVPSEIAAVGSSMGSSAVIAAAAHEPSLTTIVTLSPGRAYHGFDAITPAIGLGDRAIFAIVAHDEADGVETAAVYGRIAHVPPRVVDGNAHGVALFALDPTTLDGVEDFLRQHLSQPRAVARVAPTSL